MKRFLLWVARKPWVFAGATGAGWWGAVHYGYVEDFVIAAVVTFLFGFSLGTRFVMAGITQAVKDDPAFSTALARTILVQRARGRR